MAPKSYSERFLRASAPGVWVQYRIPDGKRAVVRCCTFGSNAAAGASVIVQVGYAKVMQVSLPGTGAAIERDLYVVGYEGELIETLITGTPAYATVSGYLFDVLPGSGPPAVTRELADRVVPLPTEGAPPAGDGQLVRELEARGESPELVGQEDRRRIVRRPGEGAERSVDALHPARGLNRWWSRRSEEGGRPHLENVPPSPPSAAEPVCPSRSSRASSTGAGSSWWSDAARWQARTC